MGKQQGQWGSRLRFAGTCALALGLSVVLPPLTGFVEAENTVNAAATDVTNQPLTFQKISEGGFGNCLNSYSWSMAWFKGHLYVGTNKGSFLQAIGFLDPDYNCYGNDPATDPAAEIWRYTPETDTWDLVFQSPTDVPVWGQPNVMTSRDNGFRDMLVFTEPDGTEALYVAGLIYPFLFETRTPRILRSTDGVNFDPIPEDPGTVLGDISKDGTGFRAMASYKGRFYITVGSVVGEGIILESSNPAEGDDSFHQVSPPGMLAFELADFNGYLYVGSGEASLGTGFEVLKTDATPNGTPYYDFVPVVTHGAYGPYLLGPNNAVLSMQEFQGRLYIGGQNDLVRVNPDDTWDLIVGNPRSTPQGDLVPLSGFTQGFGNWFTGHFWRMAEQDGSLYLGTWDYAVFFRNLWLLGPWIDQESGFDLWKTDDGISWSQITRNGLGNIFNHGVRSLQSTPYGLFLGTANPFQGTEVYLGKPDGSIQSTAQMALEPQIQAASAPAAPLSPPDQLEVESQDDTTILSWEPSPAASQFQILRATHVPAGEVSPGALPQDAWVAGAYEPIGTTKDTFFRDSTIVAGYRYTYTVQAEGEDGQLSQNSNVVMAPTFAPAVTFKQVQLTVRDMARRRKIKTRTVRQLSRYLAAARAAVARRRWSRARRLLEALERKTKHSPPSQLDSLAAQDLEAMTARLLRRVELARSGVIPRRDVLVGPRPATENR